MSHRQHLVLTIGTREEYTGHRAWRADHDPSLGPSIGRGRGNIFHQFETENVHKEIDRRVVLPDDERDKFNVCHRSNNTP